MKGKPDVTSFSYSDKKNVSSFLDGASSDSSSSLSSESSKRPPAPTVQKIFRLKSDTVNALKLFAANKSVEEGRRVTELEIVEGLIRDHLKI